MGEIADDMIDGLSCSLCGIYFVEEHGYPVVCTDCWDEDCGYGKATEEEL